jgi:hypothetical protein
MGLFYGTRLDEPFLGLHTIVFVVALRVTLTPTGHEGERHLWNVV